MDVSVNKNYFFLSGLFSFLLFFVVFILFFTILDSSNDVKHVALKKDKYISISIHTQVKRKKRATKKTVVKKKAIEKKKSIKSVDTVAVNEDINFLFSDVKTRKIVHKKREVKRRKIDKNVLRVVKSDISEVEESKKKNELSEKLKKLQFNSEKISLVNQDVSSAEVIDEFLANVQNFIYENFFPPLNSEGNSAKVRIWITNNGTMERFQIIASSGNEYFDNEVALLKRRLKGLQFPLHPEKKAMVIDIILTAKE